MMSTPQVDTMWDAITQMEAQQELLKLKAQDWPHMKQDEREEYHRILFEKAYPSEFRKTKHITIEDLQNLLGS